MSKTTLAELLEWGKWECPECLDKCEDKEDIWITTCSNGHTVRLSAIQNGHRIATIDPNNSVTD